MRGPVRGQRRSSTQGTVSVVAAALLTLLLGACDATSEDEPQVEEPSPAGDDAGEEPDSFDALVSAAQEEGTVVWYTNTPPPAIPGFVDAFEERYGITVEWTRQSTSDLVTLFEAEMNSGNVQVDVFSTSNRPGVMVPAVEAGHLVPPPDFLPNVSAWPAEWTSDGGALYLHVLGVYTIAYNTELVGDDVPTEWEDLLDPQWEGEILLNDPRSTAGALGWLAALEEEYGPEFLEQLGQQDLQFITSTVTGVNSLAAGDAAMLVPSSRWNNVDLIAEGAPIDDAYPSPAMGGSEGWFGLVNGAPHPNAAALFMDFMLSPEGQSALCTDVCMSVIDAPGTLPFPEDYSTNDLQAASERRDEILGLMGLD